MSEERVEDAALQEYAVVFRSSPTGMAVMDEQGRFLRADPALCGFLGRDADWLVGRSPDAVTLPEDVAVTGRVQQRLNRGSSVLRVHERYLRPDGSVVHGW